MTESFIKARSPLQNGIHCSKGFTCPNAYYFRKGYPGSPAIYNGFKKKIMAFESTMIFEAIKLCNGNQSAAARLLNITERHLRSRMEKLGLKNKFNQS